MIKIIKTEYASEFSPIVRTEHVKDLDFFDLTAFDLTKDDFADYFREHIGDFGNITSVHDDGSYISVKYERQNSGILEIYPEPPLVPKKKDKRPTKNLESLVKYANSKGYHVGLTQMSKKFGYNWYGFMYREDCTIVSHTTDEFDTAYQAVKWMLKDAGLL
jgi:hypothetical protein